MYLLVKNQCSSFLLENLLYVFSGGWLIHLSTSHPNASYERSAIRAASVPDTIGDCEAVTPDQSTTAHRASRVLVAIVRHIAYVDVL
jgi:hypothetical protein